MRQFIITVPEGKGDIVVDTVQDDCSVTNVTRVSQGGVSTITFIVGRSSAGFIMGALDTIGCGIEYGRIALLPVEVLKPLPAKKPRVLKKALMDSNFMSKRARMATEEIYADISDQCEISFDYIMFILIAGMIAAIGLATNNPVMIVASMLLSPLMGPILGFTFGTAIRDRHLFFRGLRAEAVGVVVTFLTGLVVGLAFCVDSKPANNYGWPTEEMDSRGEPTSLITGFLYAVPSGAGVALSAMTGGVGALVGVAIAASLLPPIVNSGMCFGFALAGADRFGYNAEQFYRISGYSLILFLVNVGCIYAVSLLFYRIKHVTPVRMELATVQNLPIVATAYGKNASPTDGNESDLAHASGTSSNSKWNVVRVFVNKQVPVHKDTADQGETESPV